MKILINGCYGCIGFSKGFKEFHPEFFDEYGWFDHYNQALRSNQKLIAAVERYGIEEACGKHAKLEITEIPDEATDYYVNEYDGMETVIFVVDGKLHFDE